MCEVEETKVYFAYENAGDPSDAVALAMTQLNEGLRKEGLQSDVLLATWRRHGQASTFRKMIHQANFLIQILFILLKSGRRRIVITLDAPSGLRLLTQRVSRFPRFKVTHVLWVMDLYRFTEPSPSSWNLHGIQKKVDQLAFEGAENIVVLGKCMTAVIRREFGVGSTVIPIWQDTQKFNTPDPERVLRLRQQFDLKDKLVVLYSGTARSVHPLQTLVDAATIMQGNSNVAFLIIGRGPEIDRIRHGAHSNRLANMHVLDYMPAEDVPAVAELGDVHVVSLSETATGTCVPSKGYAGMAAGKPILYIGSPNGQLAADISESNSGLVVSGESPAAIVDYLLGISADKAERLAQGSNAREYFEANRTSAKGTEAWARYLRSL